MPKILVCISAQRALRAKPTVAIVQSLLGGKMPKRRRNPQVRRPMDRCERGNWLDAEGYIDPTPHKESLRITQVEREPLEDYCAGAIKDGIPCRVKQWKEKPYLHYAIITGLENIAKEIVLTQNCIRTRKKQAQIQAFKNELARPRKRLDPRLIKARKILGI